MRYVIVFILFFFSSCYTEKKAADQVDKALSEYPEVAAKLIREEFPCVDGDTTIINITTDSSEFVRTRDSAILESKKTKVSLDSIRERIKSLPDAVKEVCGDYELIIDAQKQENDVLNRLLANVKPKIVYRDNIIRVEDSAKIFLAIKEKNEYKKLYEIDHDYRLKKEAKEKGKLVIYIPKWLIVLLIIISGLLIYTKVKTGFINPVKLLPRK